jgi:predicted AAA+ superfamily ATPase
MFNTDNFLGQNPWRLDKSKLIPFAFDRTCWKDLVASLADKKPILLFGPRGGGKTTLLQLTVKHLITESSVNPSSIFYFNLDDLLTREAFTSVEEVNKFIKGFQPSSKERLWILLDEVSRLTENKLEVSTFIKDLQDKLGENVKLIITVSGRDSSFRGVYPEATETLRYAQGDKLPKGLSQNDTKEGYPAPFVCHSERSEESQDKLREGYQNTLSSLEMTAIEVTLFSFKEYLNRMLNPNNVFLPDGDKVPTKIKPTEERIKMLSQMGFMPHVMPALDDYLRYGGYASVVKEYAPAKRPAILRQIYQELFNNQPGIIKTNERGKILKELARMHGNIINVAKLSKESKLNHKTVNNFIEYMEANYFLNRVYPYTEIKKKTEKGTPLVYFSDNGLRNMLLDMFGTLDQRPDRKELLDNFIYNELKIIPYVKDIRFWNSETSDVTGFVFRHGVVDNMIAVLYDFPKEKPGRWALVNMARKVKAKKVIILTKDYSEYDTVGPTKTIYIPLIWTWFVRNILEE